MREALEARDNHHRPSFGQNVDSVFYSETHHSTQVSTDSFLSTSRLPQSLQPILETLLHALPLTQSLVPLPRRRILLLPLLLELLAHDTRRREDEPMPRHERQVREGDFVAAEVRALVLLQVRVDDADDAADLVAVALEAGGEIFLGVVEDEPGALAILS